MTFTEANTVEQMILDAVSKGDGTGAKWSYVSGPESRLARTAT